MLFAQLVWILEVDTLNNVHKNNYSYNTEGRCVWSIHDSKGMNFYWKRVTKTCVFSTCGKYVVSDPSGAWELILDTRRDDTLGALLRMSRREETTRENRLAKKRNILTIDGTGNHYARGTTNMRSKTACHTCRPDEIIRADLQCIIEVYKKREENGKILRKCDMRNQRLDEDF